MQDWTSGYVAEVNYTYGYYHELNPLRARFALLSAGLHCPQIETACELGFGQGISINMHAAASQVEWHGTDFNPSQVSYAQEIAHACGNGACLYDEAFAEFAARPNLPDFDYIGMHGIWSWVSDENRAVIVDFIRRKLKVGGVLYLSYNTLPGWAAFAPIRHLLVEHAEILGAEGQGIVDRINKSLEFTEGLLAVHPLVTNQLPTIAPRLAVLKSQNRNYLAHEYFNRDWQPMYFSDMAACLTAAKMGYGCSANLIDHIDGCNFTRAQQDFLNGIDSTVLREGVRDFMINQQFRRDYWVRGARKLHSVQQAEKLREEHVVLQTVRDQVPMTLKGLLGEAALSEEIYTPILDLLADHRPRTLLQIEQGVCSKHIHFTHIVEAVRILAGMGHLLPAQDEGGRTNVKKNTDQLNARLLDQARSSGECGSLASPVTGGGVAVDRFEQLFLLAFAQGLKLPNEWASYAWDILIRDGQRLIKKGVVMEHPDDNLAELNAMAIQFEQQRKPILRAMEVA